MNSMQQNLLEAVLQKGVLIDLHFSAWTGQTQINPKDLGLDSFPKELMNLGRKRIMRKDLVDRPLSVISSARFFVEQNSHPFPLSRARFIPDGKIKQIVEKLEEYRKKFDEAVDVLILDFNVEKKQMIRTWRDELQKHFGDKVDADGVIERISNAYPTISRLKSSYNFRWTFFHLSAPEGMEERVMDLNVKEQMDESIKGFVGECVGVLRGKVTDLIEHVNKLVADQDGAVTMSRASIDSLNKEIDTIKALNFFGDEDVNSSLDVLRQSISGTMMHKNSISKAVDVTFKTIQGNVDKAMENAVSSLTSGGLRDMEV